MIATRFQWDVMGSENLLIARTDSETGKLISSTVDSRDHEFILGVAEDTKPLSEILYELEQSGASGSKIAEVEAEWVARHDLVTFDEGRSQLQCNFSTVRLTSLQRFFGNWRKKESIKPRLTNTWPGNQLALILTHEP